MHHALLPFGAFDFHIPAYMIAIIVPIAGMIFGGIMAISAMVFKHREHQLWHATAKLALEKGQPLPAPSADVVRKAHRLHSRRNDLRTGIILLAVSGGLFVFFHSVAPDAQAIAAIPACIGAALLLLGIIEAISGRKSDEQPPQT